MSLLFLKRALSNPRRVGYIVPSTPFLIHKTITFIDFSKARTVVELGPGEGCHSRAILRHLHPDARLILVELDEHFAAHLTEQFADDPRVTVVQSDAVHLNQTLADHSIRHPDYIISGIPLTIMPGEIREQLLAGISGAMGRESRFITYQASLKISDHHHFDLVRKKLCLLNIPPLHLMELRKANTPAPPADNLPSTPVKTG